MILSGFSDDFLRRLGDLGKGREAAGLILNERFSFGSPLICSGCLLQKKSFQGRGGGSALLDGMQGPVIPMGGGAGDE